MPCPALPRNRAKPAKRSRFPLCLWKYHTVTMKPQAGTPDLAPLGGTESTKGTAIPFRNLLQLRRPDRQAIAAASRRLVLPLRRLADAENLISE